MFVHNDVFSVRNNLRRNVLQICLELKMFYTCMYNAEKKTSTISVSEKFDIC